MSATDIKHFLTNRNLKILLSRHVTYKLLTCYGQQVGLNAAFVF